VIHVVVILFKHALELSVITYVGPIVFLIGLMLKICAPDVMASLFEFGLRTPSVPIILVINIFAIMLV
jgi:hypothetical protein